MSISYIEMVNLPKLRIATEPFKKSCMHLLHLADSDHFWYCAIAYHQLSYQDIATAITKWCLEMYMILIIRTL